MLTQQRKNESVELSPPPGTSQTYQIGDEGQVDHAEKCRPDVQTQVVQRPDVIHHEVHVDAADEKDHRTAANLPEPASKIRARGGETEGPRLHPEGREVRSERRA